MVPLEDRQRHQRHRSPASNLWDFCKLSIVWLWQSRRSDFSILKNSNNNQRQVLYPDNMQTDGCGCHTERKRTQKQKRFHLLQGLIGMIPVPI